MFEFIIAALAVYGTSVLLTSYDGFNDVFLNLRNKYPNSFLKCLICTSLWVSLFLFLPFILGHGLWLAPLAFVGIIIIIEDLTR